jgi:hypothetical protein
VCNSTHQFLYMNYQEWIASRKFEYTFKSGLTVVALRADTADIGVSLAEGVNWLSVMIDAQERTNAVTDENPMSEVDKRKLAQDVLGKKREYLLGVLRHTLVEPKPHEIEWDLLSRTMPTAELEAFFVEVCSNTDAATKSDVVESGEPQTPVGDEQSV